jgi:hypothetical protein
VNGALSALSADFEAIYAAGMVDLRSRRRGCLGRCCFRLLRHPLGAPWIGFAPDPAAPPIATNRAPEPLTVPTVRLGGAPPHSQPAASPDRFSTDLRSRSGAFRRAEPLVTDGLGSTLFRCDRAEDFVLLVFRERFTFVAFGARVRFGFSTIVRSSS